jgi:plasmid stabilization system protein ParE
MKEIIWSDEAIQDYHQNIEYLMSKWSEESASAFIEEVEATLELIHSV